jgi:sirohydrochlorin cobaltochelatase
MTPEPPRRKEGQARGARLATWFGALLVGLSALGCSAPRSSPTTASASASAPTARRFGVLLMAHGGSPEWNAAVLETVKPLQNRYAIEVAFGMADAATLDEGVRKLEARSVQQIGVVRLFVSGESFTRETEQIFGLRPGAPTTHGSGQGEHGAHAAGGHGGHGGGHSMAFYRLATRASFALSIEGLADASGMGNVLADRASALSKAPSKEDVLILGHGPGDDDENARWIAKIDARAEAVRTRAPFRRVQVETLREDWPDKRVDAEKRIRAFVERAKGEGGRAIVIPFRVQGFGPYAKVLEGLEYSADGTGLIPHEEVTKWIEREIVKLEAGPFRAPSAG